MSELVFYLILVVVFFFMIAEKNEKEKLKVLSEDDEQEYLDSILREKYGDLNEVMMCPHCNVSGHIRTRFTDKKKGISGGKASAAILTGGASILVTGLSRKEKITVAHCNNCNNTWNF